jgi:hypothetical protein
MKVSCINFSRVGNQAVDNEGNSGLRSQVAGLRVGVRTRIPSPAELRPPGLSRGAAKE